MDTAFTWTGPSGRESTQLAGDLRNATRITRHEVGVRFLDKRFFHRRRWEFDLKEFAWEHIGLARSYDAAGLKRKLTVGIVELERNGFLLPLQVEERFRRTVTGQWRVMFE
jgi:hypothetical protein